MYYSGEYVHSDYTEAEKWYRKAAEQGHLGSQIKLGDIYHSEQYKYSDYAEAAKWYRKAAEQGHLGSQKKLGDMLYNEELIYDDSGGYCITPWQGEENRVR